MNIKKSPYFIPLLALLLAACSAQPTAEAVGETVVVQEVLEAEGEVVTVVVEVEAEEYPAVYPTPGPEYEPPSGTSPYTPAPTRRASDYEPVTAGLVDDNLEWADYQAYLAEHSWLQANRRDVSERYRVQVFDAAGQGVHDAEVHILSGSTHIFTGRTDAGGQFWFHPRAFRSAGEASTFTVTASKDGISAQQNFPRYGRSEWYVRLDTQQAGAQTNLDLLFLMDATGSMSDEISKLKATVGDIADQIAALPQRPDVRYGLVAYRDRGDAYVVRNYDFMRLPEFQNQLNKLEAAAGGDYPESVNEALYRAIRETAWRQDAVRLITLVADAPPHLDYGDYPYDASMIDAVVRGIKIFPIGASGLDEQGAYIFRQLAQFTGGKFVFLTYADAGSPGSGPGGDTDLDVSGYSVETLDRLIVRLVTEELARLPKPQQVQSPGGPEPIGRYPAPQQPPVVDPANPVWWISSPQFAATEPLSWYANGDFEEGLKNWFAGHGSNVADTWAVTHMPKVGERTGVVELQRSNAGTDGGTVWLEQRLDMDVSDFGTISFQADLRVLSHTLGSSGWWCDTNGCAGEYPLRFSIFYRAEDGRIYMWSWGFLNQPNSAGLPNYSVVPAGTWMHFQTPNLSNLSPRPISLEAIRISAAGWDFHSQVDNAVLVLEVP